MKPFGRIVCGGGWKERRERPIKFKAVCCVVAFFPVMMATPRLGEWIGSGCLMFPGALVVGAVILFWLERPQQWWGPPDVFMPELDQPVFGQKAQASDTPKRDPYNLH